LDRTDEISSGNVVAAGGGEVSPKAFLLPADTQTQIDKDEVNRYPAEFNTETTRKEESFFEACVATDIILLQFGCLSLRRRGISFSYALRKTQKIFFNGCRAPRSLKAKATSLRWIVNFPVPVSPEYRHFLSLKNSN
jgi:hypothetical protein